MNMKYPFGNSTLKPLANFLLMLAAGALLAACGGGDNQDPDPLVEDFGIAFVMRPLEFDDEGLVEQPDIREVESFTPGGDLYYRNLASPSAPQRNVTGALTGGLGDVKDVEVSYDGERILFAMRMPDIEGLDPEDQPKWNIWEYEITTDTLRRIIASDITAETGHDIAPHYLPDGRIIFSSTRQRRSRAILLDEGKPEQFSALDENRSEHAMVLHVMDSDGGNITQLSYNQSHDLDPTLLDTGEVVFSRWDNMGSREAISLYRMHPDGSELQIYYGAHSHATGTNDADVHFLQPRQMPDGRLMTVLLPFTDTHRGGDLVLIDVANYIDNTAPTAINQGVLFGPAQEPATVNDVTTDATLSPGGRFMAAWPLQDNTNRALVSWSACRLLIDPRIVPCTDENLADPTAVEADPIYGIFLYDMDTDTQLPLVVPVEGFLFTDVVAAVPRALPPVIFDKQPGIELDQQAWDEGVGFLDIRSVYDIDGVDTTPAGIAAMADPLLTPAGERPARFLRIVKAVAIPDAEVKDLDNTAYGVSTGQLMREIIGYVPVQPDGSVRVKVPAEVPLAISVVDADGQRIGGRHQNWLQVLPGETVTCNGCHSHASGIPHGHPEGPPSVWAGAAQTGVPFPNTLAALSPDFMDTMAQTLTRFDPDRALPSVDLVYDDVWTNPDPVVELELSYTALDTPAPALPECQDAWTPLCRTVIHYETHIHPLWNFDRGENTCTNCHTSGRIDMDMMPIPPDADLDLTDGLDPTVPEHFRAYQQLFSQGNGPMTTAGAAASDGFFSRFIPGASHDGYLTPAELRLLAEWLDIGAQYYNDPFAAP